MRDFDKTVPGEMNKQDFLKKYGRKVKINTVAKAVKKQEIPDDLELPEEYGPDEEYEESPSGQLSMADMRQAEQEIVQRQLIEYKETTEPTPESQAEMDNKLLQVAARMSVRKELLDAVAPDGSKRKVAIPIEEEYPEIFTEDLIKGNYGEEESACIFGNGSLINSMKTIGQAKNFSFVSAARFNKNQMDLMINLSRGLGGFSARLTKTNMNISEGQVSHIQRTFAERKEKKWRIF